MYSYATDHPVELEIEAGQPITERPKYEVIIISIFDIHIALGFLRGELVLLVAGHSSQDATQDID